MKILTFDPSRVLTNTVAPFVIESCIEAFRKIGHEVIQIEPTTLGKTQGEWLKNLEAQLLKAKPDFVFTLNDFCLTPEVLIKYQIPYVSWFGDNPLHSLKREHVSPYYTVFVWDKVYIQKLKDLGVASVFHLPLATNPRIFDKIRLSEWEREKYGCNISFAGSPLYSHYKKYKEGIKHPELRAVINEIVETQSRDPLLQISDIIKRVQGVDRHFLNFKNTEQREKIETWLEHAAMAKYRKEIIEEVADLGIDLYGDERWASLIEKRKEFKIRFFGWIDPNREVFLLYNATKINLNITKCQAKTALNWRVFDILACGAFMLTDFRQDLKELFDAGKEVIFFKDRKELRELALYFLDHSKERDEISRRGRERVLKEHTFIHRMKRVIKVMGEVL
jgi:spore maturation protein CgeB